MGLIRDFFTTERVLYMVLEKSLTAVFVGSVT